MTDDPTDFVSTSPSGVPIHGFDDKSDRPRIWTVFSTVIAAIVAIMIAQAFGVSLLISLLVAQGSNPEQVKQELTERLDTPLVFVALGVCTQLAVGFTAWFAASRSPIPARIRLGLIRSRLPRWSYPVLMVGSLFPLAIGVCAALALARWIPPQQSPGSLYDNITPRTAVPFLLFISLFPGFFEELLWRGYVQRKLLARWSPWLAISVSSGMFALFHMTPHAVANNFVLGIWFGVLAHKSDSIWPSIVCHAFINGSWNFYQIGERLFGFPEQPSLPVMITGGVTFFICFCISLRLISAKGKC